MRFRFLAFLAILFLVLFLFQFTIARTFLQWLDFFSLYRTTRNLVTTLVFALMVYLTLAIPARFFFRRPGGKISPFLRRALLLPGSFWLISSTLMFVFVFFKDILFVMVEFFAGQRRNLLQVADTAVLGSPLILTGYGALRTARDYRIERVEIESDNLPASLDGLKIVQLSDIHSGMYMSEKEMLKILELVNSTQPQIAALTGDFVDIYASEIIPVAKVFSQIRADYGIYGCMGNHDVFDDYRNLRKPMIDSGIEMLDNSNRMIKVNGDALNILGVSDGGDPLTRIEKAFTGIDPEAFKILLAHRPSFFRHAVQRGVDLQLSGHTHGGQVAVKAGPLEFNPARIFLKYHQGLFRSGKSALYVNAGVGMVFAPIRISIRPEITLITLRSKVASRP